MTEKEPPPTLSQLSVSDGDKPNRQISDGGADQPKANKRSWAQRLNPFLAGEIPPVPAEDAGLVPDMQANLWSKLTWGWMGSLMMVGYKRPLQKEDLWVYDEGRRTRALTDKLVANIEKRRNSKSKHILLAALNETFFWQFWTAGSLKLLGDLISATSPLVMKALINYADQAYIAHRTGQPGPQIGRGIGLAIALAGMQTLQSIFQHHFFYRSMMVGAMARSALVSVIYRKSLVLSNKARLEFTNGKITNLMSTDASRIDFAAGYCHIGWVAFIQVCVILAILIINIGPSALAGFGLLILSAPIIGKIVRKLAQKRFKSTKFTDARVRITQEILSSMRVIKYYAWEKSFLKKVIDLREAELKIVRFLLLMRAGVNAVSMTIPVYASILAFVTYSLTGHGLNPANIFSSLTLFNLLRMPLMFLPVVFAASTDAWVSLGRIQNMLLAGDLEDHIETDYDSEYAIVVEKGRFVWEVEPKKVDPKKVEPEKKEKRRWWQRKKSTPQDSSSNTLNDAETKSEDEEEHQLPESPPNVLKTDLPKFQVEEHEQAVEVAESHAMDTAGFTGPAQPEAIDTVPISRTESTPDPHHLQRLKDISFQVKRGEFIVIVGEIGSGKSSLLAALVGEMRRTDGVVKLGGTVAYCPQTAWIQNATARNNILFGREFDQAKYDRVIHDCALEPDFEMLPNGDMTEIGERGITISGGQKARVNVARAAYYDADIVLLDDPLSAVDAHVGRILLEECICGLMAGKTRILVTHQLHVLPRADRIFCMHQGKIVEQGTYDELMSLDGDFARLVAEYGGKEEKKEEEDGKEEDAIESIDDEEQKKPEQKSKALMQVEERATGSVAWSVYREYARAGGGLWVIPAIIVTVLCSNGVNIATSLWLSYWTSHKYNLSEGAYVGIYAALGASQAVFFFIFGYALTMTGNRASGNLHEKAINRVVRAPMAFFDTTPLGRIINRFSKDVDTMDNLLSDSYRMFLMTFTMIFATFILIIAFFYWFALALGPLIVGFVTAAMFYRATAREVKRLDSILRSHVFAQFGETLTGLTTVRAYGKQAEFTKLNEDYLDVMNRAYFMTIIDQRWLGIRLDFVGDILILVVAILVVTSRFSVSPSIAGLVLAYCIQIVAMMGWMVRQFAEVENNMNATERVHHYATGIETEAPLDIADRKPPDSWPEKGEIIMKDVVLRYREGLPAVLKNLSLHIQGGERIGIVGRTGAGKSSILVALFRIVELSGGSMTIDGVDISQIGLHDLRSKLAIIPQDPVLFQGTIRSNLDPFNEHDDAHLWESLRRAHLIEGDIASTSAGSTEQNVSRFTLDQSVDDEGLNFSLGQRQLLAMARALVRKARIIVMDEATSSVDFETDAKIQATIKREFKGATLLTIAHRLRSIINYDRIAVMNDGVAVEFDTPLNLYDNPDGIFHSLCERSGIKREDIINAAERI